MRLRFIPGWTRIVLLGAPVIIAFAALAGAYAYRSSASAATSPPNPPVNAAVEVPPPSGLLVYVSGAGEHPGLYRHRRNARQPERWNARGARRRPRFHRSTCQGGHRLPHQLRRLSEHPRAGRHAGHERGGLRHRASLPDLVTRYPALVLALAWCVAIAACVVLLPAQPAIGG